MRRWLKHTQRGRSGRKVPRRDRELWKEWKKRMKDERTYRAWTGRRKRGNVRNPTVVLKRKKRGQSESRCGVKMGGEKKAETDKWVERNEECLRDFLSSFCSFQCRAKPAPTGRRLLLHPVRPTCFPSLYPPAVVPLSSSSVLCGTQLLIHTPCIRTHLPWVCPERALKSVSMSQSTLKLHWARHTWKYTSFINLTPKLGLQLTPSLIENLQIHQICENLFQVEPHHFPIF